MELIFNEINREQYNQSYTKVEAFYPNVRTEPHDMISLIRWEYGEFDVSLAEDKIKNVQWFPVYNKDFRTFPLTKAEVIRQAIQISDNKQ